MAVGHIENFFAFMSCLIEQMGHKKEGSYCRTPHPKAEFLCVYVLFNRTNGT